MASILIFITPCSLTERGMRAVRAVRQCVPCCAAQLIYSYLFKCFETWKRLKTHLRWKGSSDHFSFSFFFLPEVCAKMLKRVVWRHLAKHRRVVFFLLRVKRAEEINCEKEWGFIALAKTSLINVPEFVRALKKNSAPLPSLSIGTSYNQWCTKGWHHLHVAQTVHVC